MSVELSRYWADVLEVDLPGFADPETPVEVRQAGGLLEATWLQRGQERVERFVISSDGDFRWDGPDGSHLSYRGFLTSAQMADLGYVAKSVTRRFPREPNYIATEAAADDQQANGGSGVASDALIASQITASLSAGGSATQLLFVKGPAGAGKTTLLKELTARTAEAYQEGKSNYLFFYVSAQGRALSNLRDAFSGELDDLRANFTRDAVPALARRGVLIPIIDGFDELLGAAGYGDAFGSLREFLLELNGLGVIVVSARSSFYEVEFVGKGSDDTAQTLYQLAPITLMPWSEADFRNYLAKVHGGSGVVDYSSAIARLPNRDRELLGKPFFASQFPAYVDAQSTSWDAGPASLLDYLIESYIDRESRKIVDRDSRPLVPVAGHRTLFEEVADQMWRSENRHINTDDLRTVAEMVGEEADLSGDAVRQFATKVTSYAGFKTTTGGTGREFAFEHEVYFDYFLAQSLRRQLEMDRLSGSFLDRGVLPDEVLDIAVDGTNAFAVIHATSRLAGDGPLFENRRRNPGAAVSAAFRVVDEVADADIAGVDFINTDFGAARLARVAFTRCHFHGTRLERSVLRECRVDTQTVAEAILLSNNTTMDVAGLVPGANLFSIVILEKDSRREVYSPREMHAILLRLGAPLPNLEAGEPEYKGESHAMLELLHKLALRYRRANVICEQDDTLSNVVKDRSYSSLRKLLVDGGIVREETRDTSGSRKSFLRPTIAFQELMKYEKESDLPRTPIGDFWRVLRRRQ
ncbi:MAG: NACHT domain-containing protein [Chloroflexi bacterium]|nr:NACHT domain-containing protein [Chloroflexota bacterium]